MALLKTVYESGVRHFDTAEAYRNPDPEKHNEKYLGHFLKTVPRDSYSVATKYWPAADANHDYETVKTHLKQSLERLQLECRFVLFASCDEFGGGHCLCQGGNSTQTGRIDQSRRIV